MAEGLLRHALAERDDVRVHSAGVTASEGDSANEHTLEILKEAGIELSDHQSQPLTAESLEQATLVLTMTSSHRECITGIHPPAREKTYLLSDFIDDPHSSEIPDPIGGGIELYLETRDAIVAAIPRLLEFIDQLD